MLGIRCIMSRTLRSCAPGRAGSEAQEFYLREDMRISSFHLMLSLT
jgi:hypothetical protein